MSRIFLYAHGGSGNHGCEAIVRSTAHILKNERVCLISCRPEDDLLYGLDAVCDVIKDKSDIPNKRSVDFLTAYFALKVKKDFIPMDKLLYKDAFSHIRKRDVALSIGGDNYCYADVGKYIMLHDMLKKQGAKTVLWGCSVEPDVVSKPEVAADLARYDLITARETISYEALKAVNPNTVLAADPAFTLERKDLPYPPGWVEGNMVGINASPLILSSGNGQLVMAAYRNLIQHILDTTDLSVALIPHVVWEGNDDRKVLAPLFEEFCNTGRVILLKDHTCMELKGYIARCRMLIGARTHATIAAYSSGVPTLVLGYSVKSRGIARDLFGTEKKYVLPVQELTDADALVAGFKWLLEHEDAIRAHLSRMIPEYAQQAYTAAEKLTQLL